MSSAAAPADKAAAPAAAGAGTEAKAKVVGEVDKKRLFVRWEVAEDTLKNMFAAFGNVVESRVVRGPRFRPFAFLSFEKEEDAAKAKAALEGKVLSTGALAIEFASAAGAARARDKKPREKKEKKEGSAKPAKAAPANGDGGAKRGGRRGGGVAGGRGGAAAGGAAAAADGAGRGRRGRRRARGGAKAAESAANKPAAAESKREAREKDPNWGRVVRLVPDPIANAIPKGAALKDIIAGDRTFRAGKTSTDAKHVGSLVLNADPTKGPFNCDFTLGNFQLKLLEVRVTAQPDDVRVICRILHPESSRNREVYLRVKGTEPPKHKFLELRNPVPAEQKGKEDTSPEVQAYFVTIDSITLDPATGLWKKILLSLVSLMVPRRPPAAAGAAATAAPAAGAAKEAAK